MSIHSILISLFIITKTHIMHRIQVQNIVKLSPLFLSLIPDMVTLSLLSLPLKDDMVILSPLFLPLEPELLCPIDSNFVKSYSNISNLECALNCFQGDGTWHCMAFSYMFATGHCNLYSTMPIGWIYTDEAPYICVGFAIVQEYYAKCNTNLALNRPAYGSSNIYKSLYHNYASMATDGNRNPNMDYNSCFQTDDNTNTPTNNWWFVDLQNIYKIIYIAFTNRISTNVWSINRASKFIVGLSDNCTQSDGIVRGTYPLCGQFPGTPGNGSRCLVFCGLNLPTAKFVIIQLPAGVGAYLTICELEVYGFTV